MTVLDGLLQIRESQDASLAWRFSCRMGVCGSCAMNVNGRPRLACNTQIRDVSRAEIRVAPLGNFPIIKDLVTGFDAMFERHTELAPYITRNDTKELEAPSGEFRQTPEELTRFLQFSGCIKCGACMAACPRVASDVRFFGPMPLTAAHRYNTDNRDDGFSTRKLRMQHRHAAEHCHYAGECSRVCPKGVDPARALQLLRRDLLLDWLGLRHRKALAAVRPVSDLESSANQAAQTPPPFTVER
jgi:succinate dehydrogenase / fumarate reductase iron-sulfur subunit